MALWKWLIEQGFLSSVLDALLKHGMLVTMLVALLIYTEMQRHRVVANFTAQINNTEQKVMACQNELLRLYREDRQQTLDVLRENGILLQQVKIALER